MPDHSVADPQNTKKQSNTPDSASTQEDLQFTNGTNINLLTNKTAAADDDGAKNLYSIRRKMGASNFAPATILALQRTIGNAAVNRMIQRDDDEEAEKQKAKVVEQVKAIKGVVGEWKTFRGNPTKREKADEIGGNLLSGATYLSKLVGTDSKLREAAKNEMGTEDIAYVIEMISFYPPAAPRIGDVFPDAAQQPVNHKYVMSKGSGEGSAIVQAIQKIKDLKIPLVQDIVGKISLSQVEISYTNDFNWAWRRQVDVSGINVSVGLKLPFTGKDKGSIKPGTSIGALSISVSEPSNAFEKVPFWGLDDVDHVPILVAEGPGGSISVAGAGGKINTGKLVQLVSGGWTLSFPLKADLAATGFDLKNSFEGSLTIVAGGAGITTGQESEVFTQPLEPTVVEKTDGPMSVLITGFDTGEDMPGNAQPQFNEKFSQIQEWVKQKNERVKKNAAILELHGVDQPYKLDIVVEGYASRRWAGAGNDDNLRKQKNLELSQRRADNVATSLQGHFASETSSTGAELNISSVGRGAAMYHSEAGPGGTSLEYLVIEDEYENITGQKEKETWQDKKSDAQIARLVIIRVTWRGYDVQWASAPMSPGVPNSSGGNAPGGDGGGGAGGAPGSDGGGGAQGSGPGTSPNDGGGGAGNQ